MAVSLGPRKMTDDVVRRFVEAVSLGLPMTKCCDYARIHYNTFSAWRAEDQSAQERGVQNEYTAFFDKVREAEAQVVVDEVGYIRRSPSWLARSWFLERRFPEDFGPRQQIAVTGPDGGPVQIRTEQLASMSATELEVLDSALRKLRAARDGTDGQNHVELPEGRTVDVVPTEAWSDTGSTHRNGTTIG